MRLFTAIEISEDVRNHLERLMTHLRPCAHVKWSPVYNLHITLQFIGEWPAGDLEKLETALAAVARRPPLEITVRGVGWFPNPHHPRVFWAGIHGVPQLETLAHDIEAALLPLGIARDEREFSPHLTLARIKQPTPLTRCARPWPNSSQSISAHSQRIVFICIAASRDRPAPFIQNWRSFL